MKRKIYLDGELGDKFGKELTLDVDNFRDVFRAIECQRPELRAYLIECHNNDVAFLMRVEDKPLTSETELLMNFNEGDMYISPTPGGSGGKLGGLLKIVAAVVLFVYAPTLGAFMKYLTYAVASGLASQGLAQLMAPDPATDDTDFSQDTSYLFQGAGQTILEGDPIPVLYGRLRIPGRLVDYDVRNKNSYYTEPGFGVSGNGMFGADPQGTPTPGGPSGIPPDTTIPLLPIMPRLPGQTNNIDVGQIDFDPANIVFSPSVILGN